MLSLDSFENCAITFGASKCFLGKEKQFKKTSAMLKMVIGFQEKYENDTVTESG